ncbi:MAG: hypothetical protein L0170_16435, partial [Acidobacteria bacterium]|nr:hypothetical protein [Acidobacteriota bacterium]
VPIPSGQDSVCSVCYGDPAWGTDGLLRGRMEEQARSAESDARQAEEAEAMARLEREYDPGLGQP